MHNSCLVLSLPAEAWLGTTRKLISNTYCPYKNLEHALHTLYTQFAFVLHSFCALVNHILHMYKMCVVSKILGTCAKCAREVYICNNMCAVCAQSSRYVQNMRSLRTILKICAKYAQFAHNPQGMCKICALCAHKKRRKKKYNTSCWSPVQALGRPNVREPVLSMWYGLRHLQLHCLK